MCWEILIAHVSPVVALASVAVSVPAPAPPAGTFGSGVVEPDRYCLYAPVS